MKPHRLVSRIHSFPIYRNYIESAHITLFTVYLAVETHKSSAK